MRKNVRDLTSIVVLLVFAACSRGYHADVIIFNANIYMLDSLSSTSEAMAIKDGKILALGNSRTILEQYRAKTQIDAERKYVYPGFIDGHAHFQGYAMSLQSANLANTASWEKALIILKEFEKTLKPGEWLTGRGWDQNLWPDKSFPNNEKLNGLFPDRPVLLTRIDGHAAIANRKALQIANITTSGKIEGGDILPLSANNPLSTIESPSPSGVLIDNAIHLVSKHIPTPDAALFKKAYLQAQQNCFAMGLTTIVDCGLNFEDVERIAALQQEGSLKMKLYVMLSDAPQNYDYLQERGVIKTGKLHVRGFKIYGDGALGSRGARLIEPYNDDKHNSGFLLSSVEHFDSVANWINAKQFQMCTHAIGDSGNRAILNVYSKYLQPGNDLRWRIEHAQVVSQNDFALFGKYNIIPSVQPTHATSDMYWAINRLGHERVKGAYAYKQLLDQNNWIILGTDFPVEDISPFKTFYAATTRKDADNWPDGGFQVENALTREATMKGMTIWAAKGCFEEKEKGSLEPGKAADFIILDRDILTVPEKEILQTQVLKTFVDGELVFER